MKKNSANVDFQLQKLGSGRGFSYTNKIKRPKPGEKIKKFKPRIKMKYFKELVYCIVITVITALVTVIKKSDVPLVNVNQTNISITNNYALPIDKAEKNH